jgi:uncharacterized repeat protein (TIGR03803 family)
MIEYLICEAAVGARFVLTERLRWCAAALKLVVAIALALTLLVANAWAGPKYRVLHSFGTGNGGGGLWGSLTLDPKGHLYGTTIGGGVHDDGTVFELTLGRDGRWTETVLHSFDGNDGDFPFAGGLVFDASGTLYGTCRGGGTNAGGTVFELKPGSSGWTLTVLDNHGSNGGLILDKSGNLYGPIGPGKYGNGAITEIVRGSDGWTEDVLYSFCPKAPCVDGDAPYAGLTWDATGNLYGTTEFGGRSSPDYGTAFELKYNPDGTWQHLLLHSFPSFPGDGEVVYAGLVLDGAGNLYGATNSGGGHGCGQTLTCGTVFKLSPTSNSRWKETIVYRFPNPSDGFSPGASLVFDQAGNLYATTALGGINACANGCGVVFKLTPGSNGKWNYSVLHRFTGSDGANPAAALILDQKGNLYGTTTLGGAGGYGVVFEITP